MKKFSIIMLILLAACTFIFAGSLPDEVMSIRAVGDYRQMTSTSGTYKSVNKLLGAGVAFDYDLYLNNYVGFFFDFGLTVPVKSDVDGVSQAFEYRDFPVYTQMGLVGRMPASNTLGLDFRFGIGIVYDKATSYGQVVSTYETKNAYFVIYQNYTLSKIECQLVAGLGVYANLDAEGDFGVRVGAMAAYTFATGLYEENGRRYNDQVADLKRVGFEIQPYVALTFGFGSNN